MSKHTAPRNRRRMLGAVGAGAVLAAMLTTGAASASQPDPAPSCAEALQALNAAEAVDATETDGSDTTDGADDAAETDGSDGPDGAGDVPETDGSDELDGADDALDGAEDVPEVGDVPPFDADDVPETDGSDVPETDGSDALDGADDALETDGSDTTDGADDAPETDGSDTPETGEISPEARQAAIDAAKEAADEACRGPQGEPGRDGISAVIVLGPGKCAKAIITSDGTRLIKVVGSADCPKDCPPAPVVNPSPGDRVVTVTRTVTSQQPSGSVTYLPGTGSSSVVQAPAPTIVESDLPVTH